MTRRAGTGWAVAAVLALAACGTGAAGLDAAGADPGDPGPAADAPAEAGPDAGPDGADPATDVPPEGDDGFAAEVPPDLPDALPDAAPDPAPDAPGDRPGDGDGPDAADTPPDLPPDPGLAPVREPSALDDHQGIVDLEVENDSGWFRPARLGDRWVLATPEGHAFLSLGVTTVTYDGDKGRGMDYSSYSLSSRARWGEGDAGRTAFCDAALLELRGAGFTSVGGWSQDTAQRIAARKVAPLPYTVSLAFSGRQQDAAGQRNVAAVNDDGFPDVFDPDFADNCRRYAASATAPFRQDPFLIGYFLDNELKWWGEGLWFRAEGVSLADGFLALPADAPGKQAWVAFLRDDRGYGDPAALDAAWGTSLGTWEAVAALGALPDDPARPARAADKAAFVHAIARAYVQAADGALRQADPDHLDLCVRVASSAPMEVFRALAPCDVLTVNDYYTNDDDLTPDLFGGFPEERWAAYALAAGGGTVPKPTLLTEFGLRATDSGMPNGMGAGFVGSTQADRGAYYRDVLDRMLALRAGGLAFVVGFHWFEWRDEPKTGRWDGEDGNYGLVASDGSPYRTLWHAMASRHALARDRLLGGSAPMLATPAVGVGRDGAGWPLLSWDPVPGAAAYEVRLAPAPWMPGEVRPAPAEALWEQGPGDLLFTTDGTSLQLPLGLPAGTWWAEVVAFHGGMAFPSVPSPAVAVEAPRACGAGDTGAWPPCLRNHPPGTARDADGWARAAPVRRGGATWHSLRFLAGTLGRSHPRNGGPGAEIALSWEPPAPLAAGAPLPGFCAAPVVLADGTRAPASRFLRLRLRGADGAVLSEGPLDPGGAVAAGGCGEPPPGPAGAVAKVEWVLPTADPALPLDVPVEVLAGPF